MDIRTVGIVGAGQMGGGIAQVAAQADLGVILYDVVPAMFERALAAMDKSLLRLKEKGRLGGRDVGDMIGRIRLTTRLEDLAAADLVIEAAPEDFAIKKELFQRLDRICRPEAILASLKEHPAVATTFSNAWGAGSIARSSEEKGDFCTVTVPRS